MLPDLARAGYRIRAQQAVLFKRRIDIVLFRESDNHHCILELKAGIPPMPEVREQIRDYARCWVTSFPDQEPPRLIVIGTTFSQSTQDELARWNIESRVITPLQIQSVLESQADPTVPKGTKIEVFDPERVKRLLSRNLFMIPDGMVFGRPWDQEKVCLALANRGEVRKEDWLNDLCVHLYGPRPGCAVVYLPGTKYWRAPLHLHPRRPANWRQDVFERMLPYIEYRSTEKKKSPSCNFDFYRVLNWDGFAMALDLDA
jgi:hypothetical protein